MQQQQLQLQSRRVAARRVVLAMNIALELRLKCATALAISSALLSVGGWVVQSNSLQLLCAMLTVTCFAAPQLPPATCGVGSVGGSIA